MANRQQLAANAEWQELQNDPRSYFGDCELRLFPNGQKVIWIKGKYGGFAITAGEGPAGLGIQVTRFVGAGPITISANSVDNKTSLDFDASGVSLTIYHPDERSQAFKQWHAVDKMIIEETSCCKLAKIDGEQAARAGLTPEKCNTGTKGSPEHSSWMAGYWGLKAGLSQ